MELTRRDALVAAVGATGVATVGGLSDRLTHTDSLEDADNLIPRLQAAAEVLYPSEVEPTAEFLRAFVLARKVDEDDYAVATANALDELDRHSRKQYGSPFASLSVDRRDDSLRSVGVPTATPDPDGTAVERIRYYIVNQLLYALYTSPAGGKLVGNENPPGYPGGRQAYQEGPDND